MPEDTPSQDQQLPVPQNRNKYLPLIVIGLFLMLLVMGLIVYQLVFNKPQTMRNVNDVSFDRVVNENTPLNVNNSNALEYAEADLVYSGSAPVYVTIYSHNEDSWAAMVNTKAKYLKYREGLLERIDLLKEYDIEWDWQSDQPVVEAMIEYESDPGFLTKTDGKNILKYMSDLGISLDPHAHTNNYADIAYLMQQLGAQASSVIGGTVHVTCGSTYMGFLELDDWHANINLSSDSLVHGEDYPDALWDPKVLSDPGMGGHYFDDWSSGVWRPGNAEEFYNHEPNSDIVYIGEGYPHDATIIGSTHASKAVVHASNGQYIKELVQKITDKEFPTGTKDGDKFMYTASIHVRDTAIVTESEEDVETVAGLRLVLEELEPLRDQGKIIYLKFEDVVSVWEQEYDSVPYRIGLSDFSFYTEVESQARQSCLNKTK